VFVFVLRDAYHHQHTLRNRQRIHKAKVGEFTAGNIPGHRQYSGVSLNRQR
jgi:hypothetical protein